MSQSDNDTGTGRTHAAGAFDIRNVIAALIGFYGVVLLVVGIVDHTGDATSKTGGVNANLWAGIIMVIFAACFAIWSRVRPVIVKEKTESADG
jgi:hypothetical protein